MPGRLASMIAASLAVGWSTCAAWVAWIVGGLACDESCGGPAAAWTDSADAWQWTAIVALGVALLVLSIVLWWAAKSGRPAVAWPAAITWIACGVALVLLMSVAHDNGPTLRNLLLLGIACVVTAATFTAPEREAT